MAYKKEDVVLWNAPIKKALEYWESSEQGLSQAEAEKRLKEYGPNQILKKERRYGWEIGLAQFKNPLILLLIVAAIVSYFLGQKIEALVILSIVVLNALMGFVQEYRAERALRELKKYVALKAKVLRDGELTEVEGKALVPGDIVYTQGGDVIPADIRLLKAEDMTTDESTLTGESLPVLKKVVVLSEKHHLPPHLKNVAFLGTSVTTGFGEGVVIATGEHTFFGKTAAYLKRKEPEAEFQKGIHQFSNFLLKVILAMILFIFLANAVLGKGIFDSFLFAVALAVGITPEVLPVIMTLALSSGALRMAKAKVITKRLASVEDFGNIDTLCCDKTGTLTEGKLSLKDFVTLEGKRDEMLLLLGMLCNSAHKGRGRKVFGNPLDTAVWENPRVKELEPQLSSYTILDDNEFDFQRRRMSVLVKQKNKNVLMAKGAPESIIKVCSSAIIKGRRVTLSSVVHEKIYALIEKYEHQGYRVLAVAEKNINKTKIEVSDEKGLTLQGLLLFWDPPKKTDRKFLELLPKLGVNIKVISGDSPNVTRHVCLEVGLKMVDNCVINGEELERLNKKEFEEYCARYNVFARVTPEQKHKIVSCLNQEGHIVGFLGDGINDAPALRVADVGISVDTGTGMAKEAADIILLKKSLEVISLGIIEGRKTFGNITKYIMNTISSNYGNMFTVAISSLFLKFIPLLPSQILLNNFISDAPLLTISTDNVDPELIKKPKRWDIKLISRFMVYFGLLSVIFDLALILPLMFWFKASPELFRTSWFVLSALTEIVVIFALRTKLPFFKSKPSFWLVISSLMVGVVAFVLPFIYFGEQFFSFVKIPLAIIVLIVGVLLSYLITAEMVKRHFFKKFGI